jgi:uncharacterized lipoprotein YddW (UPF0748 family)
MTKAGVLNVPAWYEAGKVSNETSGIPFSEWRSPAAALQTWQVQRADDVRRISSQKGPLADPPSPLPQTPC